MKRKNKSEEVTLFLIEDDDVDASVIQRGFAKQRIANPIVRAQDGVAALEMLKSKEVAKPFIVLLDLQMPRMGGIEWLQTIRKDELFRDSVVFVLTTSDDEQDIVESYRLNVAGYFIKDETGQAFLEIINLLDGYWKVVHLPT